MPRTPEDEGSGLLALRALAAKYSGNGAGQTNGYGAPALQPPHFTTTPLPPAPRRTLTGMPVIAPPAPPPAAFARTPVPPPPAAAFARTPVPPPPVSFAAGAMPSAPAGGPIPWGSGDAGASYRTPVIHRPAISYPQLGPTAIIERPRWGMRLAVIVSVAVIAATAGFAGRIYLAGGKQELARLRARVAAGAASLGLAKATANAAAPAPAPTPSAPPRPQIVALPSPAPVAEVAPPPAPEPVVERKAPRLAAAAAPKKAVAERRVAAVLPPSRKASAESEIEDPFEDGPAVAEKPARKAEAAEAEPEEKPAPEKPAPEKAVAERAAVEKPAVEKAAPEKAAAEKPEPASNDPLNALMASALTGKKKERSDIDKKLSTFSKEREVEAPAKDATAEARAPLSRSELQTVMKKVEEQARGCGEESGVKGPADLKINVDPDGSVSDVALKGTLADTDTAGCVIKAVRAAKFPESSGLRFDYRIVVR